MHNQRWRSLEQANNDIIECKGHRVTAAIHAGKQKAMGSMNIHAIPRLQVELRDYRSLTRLLRRHQTQTSHNGRASLQRLPPGASSALAGTKRGTCTPFGLPKQDLRGLGQR